jgi:hypothetical protein
MKKIFWIISYILVSMCFAQQGAKYLVITHDNFYDAVQPLAEWKQKKGLKTKATDGSLIYAIKGAGKQDFWMYDPLAKGTWTPLDTIPRLWKKSVPKTGAGLAYLDGFVYLLKGNNTPEFWRYNATAEKSNTKTQMSNLSRDVIVNQSEAISNITPAINISPNPFTKNATIQYTVPVSGRVSIKLYNSIGRLVETLTDSHLSAGTYTMNLSANTLTKGIYFLKYEANNNKSELKLIVQ